MHTIDPDLLRRQVRVLLVGCGGSGAAVAGGLPYLHQSLLAAGHPGGIHATIMDGDIISAANCARQPFCQAEIGLSKAVVMTSRLNLFWGLNWTAAPEHFTLQTTLSGVDIVIGCVDTRTARRTIQTKTGERRCRAAYWLDLGNSADTGQFVLGQPLNDRNPRTLNRLRSAAELFPEITESSMNDDDTPSCSALEALERQEPFVNQVLAYHALALLTRLFRYGQITHHGGFVNVRENRVLPLMIDPAVWRRMRLRGQRILLAAVQPRITALFKLPGTRIA